MIRVANSDDIDSLTRIHMAALPNDVLPRLGELFLKSTFFPNVLETSRGFTLVYENDGPVQAFCIFAYKSEGYSRAVSGDKYNLVKHIVPAVFRDFSLIPELWAYVRGYRLELEDDSWCSIHDNPEMVLLATDPDSQGGGMGGELVQEGIERLSREYRCCTLKTSSERAARFFVNRGFTAVGREYRGKRELKVLLRPITSGK